MRTFNKSLVAAAALALSLTSAMAQSYPNKPIHLIVPFAPGGFTDVVARIVGQKLSVAMGQQFVVALQDHPWFELTQLAASERSAGKTYGQALTDSGSGAFRWYCPETPSERVLGMDVRSTDDLDLSHRAPPFGSPPASRITKTTRALKHTSSR